MRSKFVFIASGLLLSIPAFAAETTIVPIATDTRKTWLQVEWSY